MLAQGYSLPSLPFPSPPSSMSAFYGISLHLHLPLSALILPTVKYSQMPNQLVRAKRKKVVTYPEIHVLHNKYDPKLPSALAETSWFKS
jgi:hypothetical protein